MDFLNLQLRVLAYTVRLRSFLTASYELLCMVWATNYQHTQKMSMAEMSILCWICAWKDILIYEIKNDCIKEKVGVAALRSK